MKIAYSVGGEFIEIDNVGALVYEVEKETTIDVNGQTVTICEVEEYQN